LSQQDRGQKSRPHLEPDLQQQVSRLQQGHGPLVLELTSNGGEADSARRLAQDIRTLGRKRELFVLGPASPTDQAVAASSASMNIAGTSKPVWSVISWKQVGLVTLISVR
jgi:hypothetical protein